METQLVREVRLVVSLIPEAPVLSASIAAAADCDRSNQAFSSLAVPTVTAMLAGQKTAILWAVLSACRQDHFL